MTDVFIKEVPRMMIFYSLKAMLKQKRQMGKDFPKSIDEEFAGISGKNRCSSRSKW